MGYTDRAGLSNTGNWADDHAEGRFAAARAFSQVFDEADCLEALEAPAAADEEWFEDDLLSLIQNRPSRHARRN